MYPTEAKALCTLLRNFPEMLAKIPDLCKNESNVCFDMMNKNKLPPDPENPFDSRVPIEETLCEGPFTIFDVPGFEGAWHLTRLKLTGPAVGPISTGIAGLTSLQRLEFSNTSLSGTIPDQLFNISSLNSLRLRNTQLSGTIPTRIGAPTRLVTLEIVGNKFSGTVPPEIFDPVKVAITLKLGNENLTGTLPQTLSKLPISSASGSTLTIFETALSGTVPPLTIFSTTAASSNDFLQVSIVIVQNNFTGTVSIKSVTTPSLIDLRYNHFQNFNLELSTPTLLLYPQREFCDNEILCPFTNSHCNLGTNLCECDQGYEYNNNRTLCQDIDECKRGRWQTSNTSEPCREQYECLNLPGSFYCCPKGWMIIDTQCADINECDPAGVIVNSCESGTYCKNLNGSYECPNCATLKSFATSKANFSSLIKYNQSFKFQQCFGECDSGQLIIFYPPEAAACNEETIDPESLVCSYACKNLTTRTTSLSAVASLSEEFARGGFLYDVIQKIFDTTIQISKKRTESVVITVNDCSRIDQNRLKEVLTDLSKEIVPNAPNLDIQLQNCDVTISSTDPVPTFSKNVVLPVIAALVSVGVVLVLSAVAIYYRFFATDLGILPPDIAWSYRQYQINPFGWEFLGTKEAGFYSRKLEPGSEFYSRATQLFSRFDSSNGAEINDIFAIYNPVLVGNFTGSYKIAVTRSDQALFTKQTWTDDDNAQKHQFVFDKFKELCNKYPWNQNSSSPIIPVLHGTDFLVAEKICESGFAALSSLDAGYFGKGIYFTSSFLYTVPYCCQRKSPAVILSWVVPGNCYPVIEDHTGPTSLMGAALKPGYSSHYVITSRSGASLHRPQSEYFDELV